MFIQHKKLKRLQVPAEKVTHLLSSSGKIQLAFAGYPPQLCSAYLLQISGDDKVLIVVAFYLTESACSIFFVPKHGELSREAVDGTYEEGYSFVESMGFVLNETDFNLLPPAKKSSFWAALPICQAPINKRPENKAPAPQVNKKMDILFSQSKKSLGNFFAGM